MQVNALVHVYPGCGMSLLKLLKLLILAFAIYMPCEENSSSDVSAIKFLQVGLFWRLLFVISSLAVFSEVAILAHNFAVKPWIAVLRNFYLRSVKDQSFGFVPCMRSLLSHSLLCAVLFCSKTGYQQSICCKIWPCKIWLVVSVFTL